jgi:hypothetical protein
LFLLVVNGWLLLVTPGWRACKAGFGFDFLAFYTAGSFVAEGRAGELYDLEAVKAFESKTAGGAGLDLGEAVGPWWNPPFYGWVFAPLSRLPFSAALGVWTALNLACLVIAAGLLARAVREASADSRHWALVPLLLATCCPFYLALMHGQNTGTSLLIVTLAALAWRARRGALAGATAALLAYKPQLALVLGAVIVVDLGWRALIGATAVGGAVLLLNVFTLPGTLTDYISLLPANISKLQTHLPYLWERHVTLKAFWRLLLLGRDAGDPGTPVTVLTALSCAAVVTLIGLAIARVRRMTSESTTAARDQLIALTILATPLLTPFFFDYDLLLLAVAATLYGVSRIGRENDRVATGLWVLLSLSLFVNPYLAVAGRVNVSTLLLAAVFVRTATARWATRMAEVSGSTESQSHPLRPAA